MLDELPPRELIRSQNPCPRCRLRRPPTPDITALTRFADALRDRRPDSDSRRER